MWNEILIIMWEHVKIKKQFGPFSFKFGLQRKLNEFIYLPEGKINYQNFIVHNKYVGHKNEKDKVLF